jgi:hypothetical protein
MMTPFEPPSSESLAAVDVAEGVQYDAKCIVIEGVVSPRGQGGWGGREGKYDVHSLSFAGWLRPDGALVGRELTLLRPVPPFTPGDGVFEELPAYSIQRMSVLLSTDQTRAVVETVVPVADPDKALVELADRLRTPVVVSTRQFGDVTLNPTIGWFEGKAKWNRRMIELRFETDEVDGIAEAIKTAETLWEDQAAWKRRVDDFAVEKLLPLKNESWLDEDEAELSPDDFTAKMKLQSISFGENGRFEFWHEDGDLFWGHSIQITGNLKEGLTGADIPG